MIRPLVGLILVVSVSAKAAVLDADTLLAWRDYVVSADLRMEARLKGECPFLWTDESPEYRRRVAAGQIVIAPAIGGGVKNVTNGLIHDWIGAVFIPNATIPQVMAVMHAYDRYKEFYHPFVADSKPGSATALDHQFTLTLQYRLMIGTIVIESRYLTRDFTLNGGRHYSIANTTLVQEIERYGTAAEQRLPPGRGSGLLWDLHTIARYQERDGGVALEMEALALTRSIPGTLRWAIAPVVRRVSMSSMETALQKTRNAVIRNTGSQNQDVAPSRSSK